MKAKRKQFKKLALLLCSIVRLNIYIPVCQVIHSREQATEKSSCDQEIGTNNLIVALVLLGKNKHLEIV